MLQVQSALTSRRPLPEVVSALASWAEAETGDGRAVVLLTDEQGEVLRTIAVPSLPAAFGWSIDGVAVDAAGGPCARAAATGRPVASTDLGSDPRLSEHRAANDARLRGAWVFPVAGEEAGDAVGVLAVYFSHARPLDDEAAHRLQRVAALIGVTVERDRTAAGGERSGRGRIANIGDGVDQPEGCDGGRSAQASDMEHGSENHDRLGNPVQ